MECQQHQWMGYWPVKLTHYCCRWPTKHSPGVNETLLWSLSQVSHLHWIQHWPVQTKCQQCHWMEYWLARQTWHVTVVGQQKITWGWMRPCYDLWVELVSQSYEWITNYCIVRDCIHMGRCRRVVVLLYFATSSGGDYNLLLKLYFTTWKNVQDYIQGSISLVHFLNRLWCLDQSKSCLKLWPPSGGTLTAQLWYVTISQDSQMSAELLLESLHHIFLIMICTL